MFRENALKAKIARGEPPRKPDAIKSLKVKADIQG